MSETQTTPKPKSTKTHHGGAPEGRGSGCLPAGCVRFSLYTFAFQHGQDSFHELLLLSCASTPAAGLKFSQADEQVCRTQGGPVNSSGLIVFLELLTTGSSPMQID